MPMQVADAAAQHHDTAMALDEAAAALAARLVAPSLVLAYADARHDPAVLAEGLARRFPGSAVLGGSSCLGVMNPSGFHAAGEGGAPALGLLGIADAEGAYGTGLAVLGSDPRGAAAQATEAALVRAGRPYETPGLIWVCAAPGTEEAVLAGIADVVGPRVPVLGGSSADNEVAGHWWQIGEAPSMLRGGVAVAVLFPSSRIGHAFQSGYEPAGPAGRVTAARGRAVLAIDGAPAAEIYRGWTQGRIGAEPATILAASTWSPLARSVGAVEGVPFWLLAHPARVTEDGALALFAEVPEGTEIAMMAGTEAGLIGRIGRVAHEAMEAAELAPHQVKGALAIYCAGCMLAVRPRMEEVVAELRAALPGVPFLGAFTFGEQGQSVAGTNLHGNLMISVVVLG
jgi:hypothetical protein